MASEFSKHTSEELQKAVFDMREKLRAIRHTAAGSRSRNVREGRGIRREVARALTEMRARELAGDNKKA